MDFAAEVLNDLANLYSLGSPLHAREALEDGSLPTLSPADESPLEIAETDFDTIGIPKDWPRACDDHEFGRFRTIENWPQTPWVNSGIIDMPSSWNSALLRSSVINHPNGTCATNSAEGLSAGVKRPLSDLTEGSGARKQARLAQESPSEEYSSSASNDSPVVLGLPHCQVSSTDGRFHCSCGTSYTRKFRLKEHIDSTAGKRYTCSFEKCPETFSRDDLRIRHEKDKHQNKNPTCPGCLKSFRADYLRVHLNGEAGCRQMIAEALQEGARQEPDALTEELRPCSAPKKSTQPEHVSSAGQQAVQTYCDLCRRPFEDDDDQLVGHLQLHTMELMHKPYSCADCDVPFAFIEDLRLHRLAATDSFCGFLPDKHTCTGHHHPDSKERFNRAASTHDRFKDRLMAWETCQLRSHRLTVVRLLAYRLMNGDAVRHSIDNSTFPTATIFARFSQISIKSFNSLPAWWKAKDDEDVDALALSIQDLFGKPSNAENITSAQSKPSRPRPESTVLGLAEQPALSLPDKQRFIFPSYVQRVQTLRGPPVSSSRTRGLRRKAAGVATRWFQSGEQQHRPVPVAA